MEMEEEKNNSRREDVCPTKKGKLDLDAARDRIAGTKGPEYWRSLEELAGSPDFQDMLHREFPKGASESGANCSLRKAAGGSSSRTATILCHRLHARRVRQPHLGRESSLSSHQD